MRCSVSVDWLTFTVKTDSVSDVITDWLGLDPDLFQETGLSINGYMNVKRFSDILVCSQPRENSFFRDMGICVSMSGNGCRTFETFSRLAASPDKNGKESVSFMMLFRLINSSPDAHISRLDIACDEKEGSLNMGTIIDCVNNGEINSRLTKRTVYSQMDGRKNAGQTVYIGAPSSDFRIRIYDKAAEQQIDGHWIRVEMVLRSKNANAFVSELMKNGDIGRLAAQVLNDKLSFIVPDDTNISRCTVCVWWTAFVDELEKVHLVARCVIQHSVEKLADWIDSQVAPTLYIIAQTLGFPFVWQMAERASMRLSSKQEALIKDWNFIKAAV